MPSFDFERLEGGIGGGWVLLCYLGVVLFLGWGTGIRGSSWGVCRAAFACSRSES